MAPRSHMFWLVRGGNDPAQCEDACAADDGAGRYAVADGASEGCFSRLWAAILVRAFVQNGGPRPDQWCGSLAAAQSQWDADARGRVLRPSAERGVRQGAFATFLGIVLENSPLPLAGEEPGARAGCCRWQAVAVGDTCLMHTRAGVLLHAFPLQSPLQFGNQPHLVGSRMPADEVRQRQMFWADGLGQPGDRLWAMTDALAQWSLAAQENGDNPWSELEPLLARPTLPAAAGWAGGEGGLFAEWIQRLRDSRQLKNDDVTLLAIEP